MVDFLQRCRWFKRENNTEGAVDLWYSVPKSSMISKSLSRRSPPDLKHLLYIYNQTYFWIWFQKPGRAEINNGVAAFYQLFGNAAGQKDLPVPTVP